MLLLCISAFVGCKETPAARIPLIQKDALNPKENNNNLFVFVGEKISLDRMVREHTFDEGYTANYKVIQNVYGNYQLDSIKFEAYDHYGYPRFGHYKYALLFVTKDKQTYCHEKYQFYPLYKTKNGSWASPYSSSDYGHVYNTNTTVKPEIIDFAEEICVDTLGVDTVGLRNWYPSPYYRVDGNRIIAVYGNYIPELFKLKKEGVLKARGLF